MDFLLLVFFLTPGGACAATFPCSGMEPAPGPSVGTPPHIWFGLALGMTLHIEAGPDLGLEVGMDLGLALGSFLGLSPGTEDHRPPELGVDICLGWGPDTRKHTLPQLVPGTFLGSFEDMEVAHMVACTVDH